MSSDHGAAKGVNEIEEVFEDYIRRINEGEPLERREVKERYPEFAEPLLERLEMFELIDREPAEERDLGSIADYTLIRQIGRGGMGVVYEAEQTSMHRRVALKVLRTTDAADATSVARFAREARIAGSLHHPNIVPVFAMGIADQTPYYAMEFVEGETLSQAVARSEAPSDSVTARRLPFGSPDDVRFFANVAEAFAAVAEGLDYAHSQGVIHRDIKPSNLIVDARDDGRESVEDRFPQGSGVRLRLLDFGLARLEGHASLTVNGDLVGTPVYMSPEQSRRTGESVDHRTDIYSLGSTLYEVLTGKPPLRGQSYQDTLSRIQENEPVPPRQLRPAIPDGLEAIVLKCLRKDPGERYHTAEALAQDLRRFVRGVPVEARLPSRWEAFARMLWRRRRRVTAVGVVLVAGLIGLALATVLIARVRRDAVFERDTARENFCLASMRVLHETWKIGNTNRFLSGLAEHVPKAGQPELRGWEWYFLRGLAEQHALCFRGHVGGVEAIDWSPDGSLLASGGIAGTVRIWRAATGAEILRVEPRAPVRSVAWSPDGRTLAVGHASGADLWNTHAGQLMESLSTKDRADVTLVRWSPDGTALALATMDAVSIHELGDDGPSRTPSTPETVRRPTHRLPTSAPLAAWSPDGQRLAIIPSDSCLTIVDRTSGKELHKSEPLSDQCLALVWSADGRRLAVAGNHQIIRSWDVETSSVLRMLGSHGGRVHDLDWNGNDAVVCGGSDGILRVWDAESKTTRSALRGHEGAIRCVRWSPDDQRLASASDDGTVKLWDAERDPASKLLKGHHQCFTWSPGGRYLAARGTPGETLQAAATLYDAATLRVLRLIGEATSSNPQNTSCHQMAFNLQSNRLAMTSRNTIRIWSIPAGLAVTTIATPTGMWPVAWSPDGSYVVVGGEDGWVRIWEAATGRKVRELEQGSLVRGLDWSPDGSRLATLGKDQVLRLWEADTGQELFHRPIHTRASISQLGRFIVSFNPTGSQFAAANSIGDVLVFDTGTGEEILRLEGHAASVRSVRWNPDGSRIATGSEDRTVKLWHAVTGAELLSLRGQLNAVRNVDWNPNGLQLGAIGANGLRIWDASTGYALEPPHTSGTVAIR